MSGLPGFDAWLEAPYVNAAKRDAEFETWCEKQDDLGDLDDPQVFDAAWERFEAEQDAWAEDGYDDPDLLNDLRDDR